MSRIVWCACALAAASAFAQSPAGAPAASEPPTRARPANDDDPLTRTIDTGRIRGEFVDAKADVRVWRGIPFAATTAGLARWTPPRRAARWSGVRTCTAFGPACPQPGTGLLGPEGTSEDCLNLNVWAPPAPATRRRPVMVWIYGGGFVIGAGSQAMYESTTLARHGAVVVTFNYRLGALGFMAHPKLSDESPDHTSGNYGFLDQVAALRWVQRNIAAFGGDPDNVTIFGESAGGVSVGCHLVSPLSKGLFHRAILQSGTAVFGRGRVRDAGPGTGAEATGVALAARLNCIADENVLFGLRRVTADALVNAVQPNLVAGFPGDYLAPSVDGTIIPDDPDRLMATGHFNVVPVIIGTNSAEGTMFSRAVHIETVEDYVKMVRTYLAPGADALLAAFPATDSASAKRAAEEMIAMTAFIAPARRTARRCAAAGAPTFMYHLTRVPFVASLFTRGAWHAADLAYVFGSFDARFHGPEDRVLSENVMKMWVQFAHTGDPNVEGMVAWPAYDAAGDRHLELDTRLHARAGLMRARCDIAEALLDGPVPLAGGKK